jgi:hypothetical protein
MIIWLGIGVALRKRLAIRAFAVGMLILIALWCAVSIFWGGDTYHCPSGVPPWWPHFVPTPGF